MKMLDFIHLNEIAMRSETLGTNFEKVVLAELLKYTRGVNAVILPGQKSPTNTVSNKSITFVKPSMSNLESIVRNGAYDVNMQQKLESTHPDFIVDIIAGKRFFGFDSSHKIHIEAKSTTTGRFKYGQRKVDNLFLDEDSEAFKYLMWFAYRTPEYYYQRDSAISEFNSSKRQILNLFKVLSGSDFVLVHAVPGNPVEWLIFDNTVDLLKGKFDISPRGVLRFVFDGADLFILEKVSVGTGEIRMYSKEKTTLDKAEKVTPFKKVEEAKSTPSSIVLIFSAMKKIKSAVSGKPDPQAPVLVKAGEKIRITVRTNPSKAVEKKQPRDLIAAGTKLDNFIDILREEL